MRMILCCLLLTACAATPQIEYRQQSLPASALALNQLPTVPVITGPICRPEARKMCLDAARYLIDIEAAARSCYGRLIWVKSQIEVY